MVDNGATANLGSTFYGGTVLANYLGGSQPDCHASDRACLNAADFSPAASGFGLQRRNQFRGPGFFNTDLSLTKSTAVDLWGEGQKFVVGANSYNVLNHPNFDQPVNDVSNTQFGQIIVTVAPPTSVLGSGLAGDGSPRQIQLTAKFVF